MVGISISDIVYAFQNEGGKVLKKTKGDMALIISHTLSELQTRDVISSDDRDNLNLCFAEALDVLANKKKAQDVLGATRQRYATMIADHESNNVARVLAELCQSVIMDSMICARETPDSIAKAANGNISGKGAQALFWGAIGAVVGNSIGGPVGAVVGGAVGAAIGACGDSDTSISVTNNGGGSS